MRPGAGWADAQHFGYHSLSQAPEEELSDLRKEAALLFRSAYIGQRRNA